MYIPARCHFSSSVFHVGASLAPAEQGSAARVQDGRDAPPDNRKQGTRGRPPVIHGPCDSAAMLAQVHT